MHETSFTVSQKISRVITLAIICAFAVVSILNSQGQTAEALSTDQFHADTANPLLAHLPGKQDLSSGLSLQRDALPLNEDFSQDSSFALLQADNHTLDLRAGYGQFFPERIIVSHSNSDEIEKPGWLYLKVRFTF